MPGARAVLLALAVLLYFGWMGRTLSRMGLGRLGGVAWLLAILLGSFIDFPLLRGPQAVTVNVGGALVPLLLAVYLYLRSDDPWERWRIWAAPLLAGVLLWVLGRTYSGDPGESLPFGTVYLSGVAAGILGYGLGRSWRAGFVAGTVGVLLADGLHYLDLATAGIPGQVWLGGGGALDASLLAGLLAVAMAEGVEALRRLILRRLS
ncbi:MAG: DUF1614 domain-containing protein [Clostridiales bacterium]|nr:DUF1614 domain-containing protein [Clostridiales bacterium]